MDSIGYIKDKIEDIYKKDPRVRVSIRLSRPKIVLSEIDAQITGVYKNIFQIEESSSGSPRRHTFQYSDVLIGQVVIDELKDSFGVK